MNKELLTNLFSTDPELLSKYHILAPNSAEICAERTMNDLLEHNTEIYLIEKEQEVIGYYGVAKSNFNNINMLYGFFLKPENRTKEQIVEFWKEIDSKLDNNYLIGVYHKNTRAIDFLNKKTTKKYDLPEGVLFSVRG